MNDELAQHLDRICDSFVEIREAMRNSQRYKGKGREINRFYEAIRQFAYDIGLTPPFLPIHLDDL
jgi:hypothetical protein